MRGTLLWLLVPAIVLAGRISQADIFEHPRTEDAALRADLDDDRGQFYTATPGLMYEPREASISPLRKLVVDGLVRKSGLHDTDTAFDRYLKKELVSGQIPKSDLALTHPLILLEYSSPVMADVIKHYRISALERVAMEQARFEGIERSTENRSDRLSRQSERECMKQNADKGLVEAMRVCMRAPQPFDSLKGVSAESSLQDGRHRIHVVKQSLERLGLDKSHISGVIEVAGDTVISDDGHEELLPEKTFDACVKQKRQQLVKDWREVFKKFKESGHVGSAALAGLSLTGAPVTRETLADLLMLGDAQAKVSVFKMSSIQAQGMALRQFGDARDDLAWCARDPELPSEFRQIILEKYEYLKSLSGSYGQIGALSASYKEVLASLALAADQARVLAKEKQKGSEKEDRLWQVKALFLDK